MSPSSPSAHRFHHGAKIFKVRPQLGIICRPREPTDENFCRLGHRGCHGPRRRPNGPSGLLPFLQPLTRQSDQHFRPTACLSRIVRTRLSTAQARPFLKQQILLIELGGQHACVPPLRNNGLGVHAYLKCAAAAGQPSAPNHDLVSQPHHGDSYRAARPGRSAESSMPAASRQKETAARA